MATNNKIHPSSTYEHSTIVENNILKGQVRQGKLVLPAARLSLPVTEILEQAYIEEGDILFCAGTLIEGQGNPCSDLDVYVITKQLREARTISIKKHHRVLTDSRDIVRAADGNSSPVRLIHTAIPDCATKIDIEFRTFAEVEQLFGSIQDIYDYATKNLILLTKRVSERDESFIHRLQASICLAGHSAYDLLLAALPKEQYKYLGYRWVASDFSVLLDIAGAVSFSDWLRAVDLSRENLIAQTSGFMRALGLANFRRKWITYYVKQYLPKELVQEFQSLYLLQDIDASPRSYQTFVQRTLDFVDRIFEYTSPVLEELPLFPSGEDALRRLDAEQEGHSDLYSKLEFEYRRKAYGQAIRPTTDFEIFEWKNFD
ncbi:hypothetical protein [Methylobacter luteus]|uniref:hypothetical protein n=1 Tax=Methylobacter luteus TaxID=415 RepID=UPI00041C2652|nr:hypothetical protein [Methylobacter luteus]